MPYMRWTKPIRRMRQLISDRRGSIAVMAAFSATAVMGFGGLAVDVSYWLTTQHNMQGAADQAAYAAARLAQIGIGSPTTQAQGIAAQFGFVNNQSGATVAVNNPPSQGPYAGSSAAYEVLISQPQPLWFSSMFLSSAPTVSARSVGVMVPVTNNTPTGKYACMYALNRTMSGALHVEGGDAITSGCGVFVNSNSSTAATIAGSVTAPAFSVVGNYTGTVSSSKIQTGVAQVSDPLAYMAAPTVGTSCDMTNYSVSSGNVTLNPGVYCGGILVSSTANVTFSPGTYILKGGGLHASGSAHLSGTGVTFYNTGNSTYPYSNIDMQGNVVSSLSAPTSGAMGGMLFFQDRTITSSLSNTLTGNLTGTVYFPTTGLMLNEQQDINAAYTTIVADWINLQINTLTIRVAQLME
jgi:hypothetical protein